MRLFSNSALRVEDPFLRHALALAERARGATAPNPLVGCVVVRSGRVVGEGYHPRAGEAHAEVFALADAGAQARGADVYVTLEPCSHHGKTPPCTDALIAAGVSRVVIGMRDPNPEAARGAERLAAAGIDVEFARDPQPFAELNEGWLKRIATGLPLVTAKVALTLDGRPSFVEGERAAITGASGAEVTRRLRRRADAVVVGAATAIADDPALTVRDADGTLARHQPLRVVLVRDRVPDASSAIFCDDAASTLVLAAEDADEASLGRLPVGVLIERFDAAEGLRGALRHLGHRGLSEVLFEPGPLLLTSLWSEGLLDHLVTVTGGGMAGPTAPSLFLGKPDRTDSTLTHVATPVEAGIVGDVAVTVWRPADAMES